MRGNATMFGVNFADGRIKGYPAGSGRPGRPTKKYYVFYVRGNARYGQNDFHDHGDGTITDRATGLTWLKIDSGHLKAGAKGDVIEIYNIVRPVRGGKASPRESGPELQPRPTGRRPGGPGPADRVPTGETPPARPGRNGIRPGRPEGRRVTAARS